jgi:phosphoglycerate kinase
MDDGAIRDDSRIQAALPTIRELAKAGAAVILASHLGRPHGKVNPKYSLLPVADRLSSLLENDVAFAEDVVGETARRLAASLAPGKVMLLENLRFEPGEEQNDAEFAGKLAGLADLYVNDAFGAAHRAHASTVGVAGRLPEYAGALMLSEIQALRELVARSRVGFVAIVGGAKVTDKIGVLERLVERVETMIIGGGMANTFLLEAGHEIGTSLTEPDAVPAVAKIRDAAKQHGTDLLLPIDVVVATSMTDTGSRIVTVDSIPLDCAVFDIGPETIRHFAAVIASANTIFWNGPMGVFEREHFAKGTHAIAKAVADSDAISLVGGGDSVAAIEEAGIADQISHVSTGGGASLEFIEGRELPGITALERGQ